MALREIMLYTEPKLRKKSRKVDKIDDRLLTLLDDMRETLTVADGVGLAAPQVGVFKRVALVDVGDGLLELINPVITKKEGKQYIEEACLSVPEQSGYVERPATVTVEAYNREGDLMEYEATDLLAIAMCHEIDHLDGVLFIDKIAKLSKQEIEQIEAYNKERFGEDEDEEAGEETESKA